MTRRTAPVAAALGLVYLLGPVTAGSRDHWPAQLTTEALLAGHGFRLSAFYPSPLSAESYEVREAGGEVRPNFPVFHAVPAMPLAVAVRVLYPNLEPTRRAHLTGRAAGAFYTALALALALEVALRFTTPRIAFLLLAGAAFATPLFSVVSRALWTHGPAALGLAALAFLSLAERPWRDAGSGAIVAALAFVRPAAVTPALLFLACSAPAHLTARVHVSRWARIGAGAAGAAACLLLANAWALGDPIDGYQRLYSKAARWRLPSLEALAAYLISPGRGLVFHAPLALMAVAGAWSAWKAKPVPQADASWRLARAAAMATLAGLVEVSCLRHWWGGVAVGPRLLTEYVPLLLILAASCPPAWVRRGALLFLPAAAFHAAHVYSGMLSWDHHRQVDANPKTVWDWKDSPFSFVLVGSLRPDRSLLEARPLRMEVGEHAVGVGADNRWFVHGWEVPEPGGVWAAAGAGWHRKESWIALRLPKPGAYALTLSASAPRLRGEAQRLTIQAPGKPEPIQVAFTRGLWEFEEIRVPLRYQPGLIVLKIRPRHAWYSGSGDWRPCFFFVRSLRLETVEPAGAGIEAAAGRRPSGGRDAALAFCAVIRGPGSDQVADPAEQATGADPEAGRDDQPEEAA